MPSNVITFGVSDRFKNSTFELESPPDTVWCKWKNLYYNTLIRTEERSPN